MRRKQFATIDQYKENFPKDVQAILEKVRKTIQKSAPDATETISYGIPTFKLNGNLVHFAAFEKHIGFYPGAEAIRVFEKEIKRFKHAKGSIQFPLEKAMPLLLIQKIVKFRVAKTTRR